MAWRLDGEFTVHLFFLICFFNEFTVHLFFLICFFNEFTVHLFFLICFFNKSSIFQIDLGIFLCEYQYER